MCYITSFWDFDRWRVHSNFHLKNHQDADFNRIFVMEAVNKKSLTYSPMEKGTNSFPNYDELASPVYSDYFASVLYLH